MITSESKKSLLKGVPPSYQAVKNGKMLYKEALKARKQAKNDENQRIFGFNALKPALDLQNLAKQLFAAEKHPDTILIKEEPSIHVMRCTLAGKDTLLKRYDLKTPLEKAKYLFRPSRARRFWAAARTLQQLGIPTPEPYGYLEIYQGIVPVISYVFTAFIDDAQPARDWIEPEFHLQTQSLRDALRKDLLQALLQLYRYGIYHRDTKTANMLLFEPCDDEKRFFMWIDLECVQTAVIPTRHQIIRNLVQLNGSLGLDVTDEDRIAFLEDLASVYPWVTRKRVIQKIRSWTQRRLQKEQVLGCGS